MFSELVGGGADPSATPYQRQPPNQWDQWPTMEMAGRPAGWDEDSFHKVPLRQRSLPLLGAITPPVSHMEARPLSTHTVGLGTRSQL